MKAETLLASLAMALVGIMFAVIAANAIAPPENKPAAAPKPVAAVPAAVQPAQNLVPAPTHTAAEATAIANLPDDVRARDVKRVGDLAALQTALKQYKDKKGNYPSTGGSIQTACVYEKLDKLCEFKGQLTADRFSDPRGTSFGYFYQSDGKVYTLYASFEADNSASDPCPSDVSYFKSLQNLFCRVSSRAD
jgi:type II secretion system (T2SS) protein G